MRYLNQLPNFSRIETRIELKYVAFNWFRRRILHAFNLTIRFCACKMRRLNQALAFSCLCQGAGKRLPMTAFKEPKFGTAAANDFAALLQRFLKPFCSAAQFRTGCKKKVGSTVLIRRNLTGNAWQNAFCCCSTRVPTPVLYPFCARSVPIP